MSAAPSPYHLVLPRGKRRPVVLSCPHVGTEIPPDVADTMHPAVARAVADTDWLVHELYAFAPEMGITLLHARYSRYVIDLNRDPTGRALYTDGRAETALVPVRTFGREAIYRESDPDAAEVERRHGLYYEPYHARIKRELDELQKSFRHVLFFDAHSIKRSVPSIRPEPFGDLIVGDQKRTTAAGELSDLTLDVLKRAGFDVRHNDPFMGGYLTRSVGKPAQRRHALQLEMSQDVYLEDERIALSSTRVARLRPVLLDLLDRLARTVEAMP